MRNTATGQRLKVHISLSREPTVIKYPGKVEIIKEGRKVEELASSEKQQVDKKNIKSTLKKNTGGKNMVNDLRE